MRRGSGRPNKDREGDESRSSGPRDASRQKSEVRLRLAFSERQALKRKEDVVPRDGPRKEGRAIGGAALKQQGLSHWLRVRNDGEVRDDPINSLCAEGSPKVVWGVHASRPFLREATAMSPRRAKWRPSGP